MITIAVLLWALFGIIAGACWLTSTLIDKREVRDQCAQGCWKQYPEARKDVVACLTVEHAQYDWCQDSVADLYCGCMDE